MRHFMMRHAEVVSHMKVAQPKTGIPQKKKEKAKETDEADQGAHRLGFP